MAGAILALTLTALPGFFLAAVKAAEDGDLPATGDTTLRTTTEIPWLGRSKACNVLISVDEPLWEHRDKNMTSLLESAQGLVDNVNRVFSTQVFTEGTGRDIYFRISRIQVRGRLSAS